MSVDPHADEPTAPSEDELYELMKETFDARDVERPVKGMDMNKLMQQAQQMQAQMAQAQEEVANEIVEASAGGGMVKVKVSGAMELKEIWINPEAIDPDDPELLQDTIVAAVNEGLRSAQSLLEQRMGGMMGGLGGLGLPGM